MKSVVEGFNDACAPLPVAPVLAMHRAYPGVLAGVFIDDLAGPVGRSVVDDHPFLWKNRLTGDALDGQRDIRFLVANRGHEDVFDIGGVHLRRMPKRAVRAWWQASLLLEPGLASQNCVR